MAESRVAAALCVRGATVLRDGNPVLQEVDVTAMSGQVLAILGPNGAGKTTLLKAIAGLLPFSGEVELFGKPLSELSPRARARQLAFVPQHSLLRSALPVRRVVAQGRYAHQSGFARPTAADMEAVQRAMAKADVARFADRPFTALSFGEQRRVLLARGLCTGAKVLCLDEPTASLDIAHALSLHGLLRELAQEGHCVVVVMHDLDDALLHTDRALLMSRGRAVAVGDSAAVICPHNVAEVYGVEMHAGAGLRFSLPTEES